MKYRRSKGVWPGWHWKPTEEVESKPNSKKDICHTPLRSPVNILSVEAEIFPQIIFSLEIAYITEIFPVSLVVDSSSSPEILFSGRKSNKIWNSFYSELSRYQMERCTWNKAQVWSRKKSCIPNGTMSHMEMFMQIALRASIVLYRG